MRRPVPSSSKALLHLFLQVEFSEIKTFKWLVSSLQQYVMYILFSVVYTFVDPGDH